MTSLSVRRRWVPLTFLAAALILLTTAVGSPALADPDEGDIDADLEQAITDYVEAEEQLNASKHRQETIEEEIENTKGQVEELTGQVQDIASAAYQGGNLGSVTAILGAESVDIAIDRATMVNYLGEQSAKTVNDMVTARDDLAAEEELLKNEIEEQGEHLQKMEDARDRAADKLAANGGNAAQGPTTDNARVPDPARRNPDGSLPGEGCTVNEPKTGGCISPRTKHARDQAYIAGYQRFVSCYRPSGGGDHPLGKACDFSVTPGGFQAVHAGGGDKAYGDSLSAWFIKYADRLGVKYVIWYRMIWERGVGWRNYTEGGTDPASAHTNHVHLSML